MLFNTIDYILFLPLVIIGYYAIKPKYRWVLLLSASYYFYMCWKLEYIVLILVSTLIDYFCGIRMSKFDSKKKRLPYLVLSLVSNLGILVGFKYFNFFSENVELLFEQFDVTVNLPLLDFLLPVGISFYTFQTLSYSIDVYKGKQEAEKHLGIFALYVSYFPQLVAGPIERYSRLAPQLKKEHTLEYNNLANGFRLIIFGLFAKMVIADNLGLYVTQIYEQPEVYNSFSILSGLVFYSFQIYGDFFGYSLIAIGSAKLMGVDIMDNFNTPYLSRNIAEFWQRWHISLSTWFRDYLYYPLGGNKVKVLRWSLNILVVFVISGLWHGANLTFLFWGLIFAIAYLVEKGVNHLINPPSPKDKLTIARLLLSLKTFLIVTIAWIFFRSQSVEEAFDMFYYIGNNQTSEYEYLPAGTIMWVVLGLFILADLLLFNTRFDKWIGSKNLFVRWAVYFLLIFTIIVFAGVEEFAFIYFQF
jgi:D-alanyl-lipoteichoic acid acyltransferase DltB (MBOAT superfamily)